MPRHSCEACLQISASSFILNRAGNGTNITNVLPVFRSGYYIFLKHIIIFLNNCLIGVFIAIYLIKIFSIYFYNNPIWYRTVSRFRYQIINLSKYENLLLERQCVTNLVALCVYARTSACDSNVAFVIHMLLTFLVYPDWS